MHESSRLRSQPKATRIADQQKATAMLAHSALLRLHHREPRAIVAFNCR